MNRPHFLWQKILAFLRIRPVIGGLEITDQVLRLAHFDGKIWQLHAMRLDPGVLENGRIKDRAKFLGSLAALKKDSKVGGRNPNKKISVVVSLSSADVYSQVFGLPILGGEQLAKAVDLNLQMASPGEAGKMYSGWELVGKDDSVGRIDVLSAFVEREAVDEIVEALFTAGFLAMAVEPRSIALTRILRQKGLGVDAKKSYLLLDIDNVGIDFLVIRNSMPYFEYTNLWKDVANADGEISLPKFEEELTASLHQVANFYNQHWTEPIAGVIIAAASLHDVIEKTVAAATTLPVVRLTLEMGQPISSEWLVAIGGSLRSGPKKLGEDEITLLGGTWGGRFQEEQISRFLQFWRVLIPVVFVILIGMFWGASLFLNKTKASLEATSEFTLNAQQTSEVADLEASTTAFNNLVAMTAAAENSINENYTFLGEIEAVAGQDGVTIDHLAFPGGASAISLSGSASSDDRILAFQTDLGNAPGFSAVNLPVTSVQDNGGTYTFQMTFNFSNTASSTF